MKRLIRSVTPTDPRIWKSFDTAWRRNFAAKKYIGRPLFPIEDAIRDHRRVLNAAAKFLHTYGFYPSPRELADFMRADLGATVFCCRNLHVMELVLLRPHFSRTVKLVQLTSLGWQALGLKPIEPSIKRPDSPLERLAHQVTLDLHALRMAQLDIEAKPTVRGRPKKIPKPLRRYIRKPGDVERWERGPRVRKPTDWVDHSLRKDAPVGEKPPWEVDGQDKNLLA